YMHQCVVLPKTKNTYIKCNYVVKENARLLRACAALEAGDLDTLGKLIFESHTVLSAEYDVSCEELDFLVEQAKEYPSQMLGARMMGGGFGGCTSNLVYQAFLGEFVEQTSARYCE